MTGSIMGGKTISKLPSLGWTNWQTKSLGAYSGASRGQSPTECCHRTTKLRRGGLTHDDMKPDEQNQIEGLKPLPEAQCSAAAEERKDVFFIEDGSGLGNLANSRKSAHEYLDTILDSIKLGEGNHADNVEVVKFEYRAMTQSEIDALPEI
jgi:hypothetical protein